MACYKINWRRAALKELEKIDKKYIGKIIEAVEALTKEQHPANSKKLVGSKNTYRLRVGDYRIIYNIETETVIIEIVHVKHRKDVYRTN